jgi:hypothetical protein
MSAIPFIMVPVLCFANGCKSDVTITMNESVPPAFKFERGHVNYLEFFIVKEIAPENQSVSYMDQNIEKNVILWQIWPKTSESGRIDKLPMITYGQVLAGFSQKIPEQGPPPALVEGKVYEAGLIVESITYAGSSGIK